MGKIINTIISERVRMFIYTQFKTFFRTTNPRNYKRCGDHVDLFGPLNLDPKKVELDSHVRLQPGIRIISNNGKVIVRKFSAIGAGSVIIPGSHIPTVGVPQYLSMDHINDKDGTIIVNEDCWIGAGTYLLSHAEIGRGAVVAAGAIVTKRIPPYAVVAGSPAKIIASRFTIDQILEHEAILYPENERMTRQQLTEIFSTYYEGKKALGTSEISDSDLQRLNQSKKDKGITIY